MASHLIDQPLIDQLPTTLLVNWELGFNNSSSSQLDHQILTLRVLESLFEELAAKHHVDFCGHLVCRRCLACFKNSRLRGSDAALHRYLTCILHKTANEGDNDTCHRSTANTTLRSKMRVPTEAQVSAALASRRNCPSLPTSIGKQAQEQKVASSGVLRSRGDSKRKASEWRDQGADQMVELRRNQLGTNLVAQRMHALVERVPSPPPFWKAFVPCSHSSTQVSSPIAPQIDSPSSAKTLTPYDSSSDSRSSRVPSPPPFWRTFVPSADSPTQVPSPIAPQIDSPSSARTITPYDSSSDRRSLSPSSWSDCSIKSTPSLFDTEFFGSFHGEGEL